MKLIFVLSVLNVLFSQSLPANDTTIARQEQLDSSVIRAALSVSRGNQYVVPTLATGRIVSALGENDILNAISLRPGVSQGVEGTQANFVRGPGTSGNRIELDGVPLYRSSHLLGLVSSFPSDMISRMSFTTGGFHPSSGNLTSSLTEISLKRDVPERFGGNVSLSPFMEGGYLEIPVGSKFAARLNGRVSPAFLLADKVMSAYAEKGQSLAVSDIGGHAYDVTASFSWNLFSHFYFDGLYFRTADRFRYAYGKDKQDLSSREQACRLGLSWEGGRLGSLSCFWYKTSGMSAHEEQYLADTSLEEQDKIGLYVNGGQSETGVKLKYSVSPVKFLQIDAGYDYSVRGMDYVTRMNILSTDQINGVDSDTRYTLSAPFIQLMFKKEGLLEVKASARWSHYSYQVDNAGPETTFKHWDLSALADLYLWKNGGVEACYDQTHQFFHVLEGLPSGWGQDLMVACDSLFPAERMQQLYVGFFGVEKIKVHGTLSYSVGFFRRALDGLIGFKQAASIFGMRDITDTEDIVSGEGWSQGLETSVSYRDDVWNADVAYTFSRAHRLYPELNYGQAFLFRFDRPHILNANGSYLLSSRETARGGFEQRVSLAIVISSGSLMTAPQGVYELPFPGRIVLMEERALIEDLGQLNNFRLPLYFRIDSGYNLLWKRPHSELLANISLFNLLNRHNVYQYFYEDGKWKSLSILPIMPSIRIQYSF